MVSIPTELHTKLGRIAAELVSEACSIPVVIIYSKRRLREVVQARSIAMHLLHTRADIPMARVGGVFGMRDHTTVLHAVRMINDSISLNAYGKPYEPTIARIFHRVEPEFLERMRQLEGESFYDYSRYHQTAGYI
jgi:hypothetical protein